MYTDELMSVIAVFFAVFLVIFVIGMIAGLVFYILRSIGLWKIGQSRGRPYPWLAWIPVAGWFALGDIADDITQKKGEKTIYRFLLPGASILSSILSTIANGPFIKYFSEYMDNLQYYGSYDYPYGYSAGMLGISSLLGLVGLAFKVIMLIALYKIFKEYKPENASLWIVLSIFFGFLPSCFLFYLRDSGAPSGYNNVIYGGYSTAPPNPQWQNPAGYGSQPPYGAQQNYRYQPYNQSPQAPYGQQPYAPPQAPQPPFSNQPPGGYNAAPPFGGNTAGGFAPYSAPPAGSEPFRPAPADAVAPMDSAVPNDTGVRISGGSDGNAPAPAPEDPFDV